MERRAAVAHVDVVAVERDVQRAEGDLAAGELLDQAADPLRDGNASRVDPDEGGALEVGIPLDDLVRDAGDRAPKRFSVQQQPVRLGGRSHDPLLSGLTGPS
jgi:hypothetical protein